MELNEYIDKLLQYQSDISDIKQKIKELNKENGIYGITPANNFCHIKNIIYTMIGYSASERDTAFMHAVDNHYKLACQELYYTRLDKSYRIMIIQTLLQNTSDDRADCLFEYLHDTIHDAKWIVRYYKDYKTEFTQTLAPRIIFGIIFGEEILHSMYDTYGLYWLDKYKRAPKKLFTILQLFIQYLPQENIKDIITRMLHKTYVNELQVINILEYYHQYIPQNLLERVYSTWLLYDIKK